MNNLRLLRNQKGMSQQKLAELLHISQQSIYKYENNLAEPDIQTLTELSELFDVSIDYIVGNSDDPRKMNVFVETELSPRELDFQSIIRHKSSHCFFESPSSSLFQLFHGLSIL